MPNSRRVAATSRLQRFVIGAVERIDAALGLRHGELGRIDLSAGGHQPGDGAEARPDPVRTGSGVIGQRLVEHVRVQLVRFPVGIEIGSGIERAQERRTGLGRARENLVDEAVFGAPERLQAEAGTRDELPVVVAPAMGRREHQGRRLPRGPQHLHGPVGTTGPALFG